MACNDRIRTLQDWRPEHDDLDAIVASALAWERVMDAPPEVMRRKRHGAPTATRIASRRA